MDFSTGASVKASSANLAAMASSPSLSNLGSVSQNNKRIIYGCTTLINANQMLHQLAELGHEL